jgi:carboxypeptidase T
MNTTPSFKMISILFFIGALFSLWPSSSTSIDSTQFWLKIRATDKFQRSVIADTGVAIQWIKEDYVIAIGNLQEKKALEKLGWLDSSYSVTEIRDFPKNDSEYHNYTELTASLNDLQKTYPQLVSLTSIGPSLQGREIWSLRISGHLDQGPQMPAVLFIGGHHAREHLSVETPLRIIKWLLQEYSTGNERIRRLINSREIHFIPAVNPDGLEYDIATGRYQMWRKNRARNRDGSFGVDLNRNYGHGWGTGGSSKDPTSETYMGTAPFSEPETRAVKKYVEDHQNISTLLSFHTFSELILYPWGGKYDPITDQKARNVHRTMADKMAQWNGYTPEQASSLYIASGDTCDWAYGEHQIISFTFELDPSGGGGGGFYPGPEIITNVVNKNKEPVLYLIEFADNPYRVLDVH